MSALAGFAGATPSPDPLEAALRRLAHRGTARPGFVREVGFGLACARHMWEFSDHIAGPVGIVDDGRIAVAADASLYYRADLHAAMRAGFSGTLPSPEEAPTPSHLIAAAYRRWGPQLAARLEGDFSFILYDREERCLVAARDFAGFRPLYWAPLGTGVALASGVDALLALGVAPDLDAAVLAAVAAGLHRGSGPETAYRNIQAVPAAHTLTWTPTEGLTLRRHWEPPRWGRVRPLPFEDATAELRTLLREATRQRLSPTGPTSVPLSGGWDSTAVYAQCMDLVAKGAYSQKVGPVSISYPEGDPGREDDFIRSTLAHWDDTTHWLQVDDIALFEDFERRAMTSELPFLHLYETWNRAIARAGVADGASVQFSGYGGDQLFQVSNVYIADLVGRGRLYTAWKEWRAKGGGRSKEFLRLAVVPNVPEPILSAWGSLRGGRLHRYLDRVIPRWFDPEFVETERLREREASRLPSAYPGSHAEREWRWFLLDPFFPMVGSRVADFCLETGVESRAPLYDRRIVEFCATRPPTDLSWGSETKRLLRAATRGLVPDTVLAPRPHRTGVTSAYAERQFEANFPEILRRVWEEPFRLAELGIIRAEVFRNVCSPVLDRGRIPPVTDMMGMFYTVVTELWLRGHPSADRP